MKARSEDEFIKTALQNKQTKRKNDRDWTDVVQM